MLEAPHRQVWELKIPKGYSHGGPQQYSDVYPQEDNQIPTVNIREESPRAGAGKGEKEPFWNVRALFHKTYPQEPKLLRHQDLTDLGKGNTYFQPTLVILSHLRGKEKRPEKHMWSSRSRDTGSPEDWDLNRTVECSLFPHLTTTSLKVYLKQFLAASTSCPALKKNIRRHTKRQKKKKFEGTEQASEPDMKWYWNYQTGNLKQLWLIC